MTFEQSIQTNWRTVFDDLRTKLGGMTNWNEKSHQSDPPSGAESFTLTLPTGEDLRFVWGGQGLTIEYGQGYSSTDDTWTVQYTHDPVNEVGNGNINNGQMAPSNGQMSDSDTVLYDIYYSSSEGFTLYAERQMDDGSDHRLFIGFAQLDKLWDYTNANSVESEFVFGIYGGAFNDYDYNFGGSTDLFNSTGETSQQATPTKEGSGRPNADSNFSDYPASPESVVASEAYNDTLIGSHNLWFRDYGGAHGDVINDSNTGNSYLIRNPFNETTGVAIRTA